MELLHSFSNSVDISTSIIDCNFKFNVNDRFNFIITLDHLEKLIKDGFDLKINFKEYKSLLIKIKQKKDNYKAQRELFRILSVRDLDIVFCHEENKITTMKEHEEFTSDFINEYFTKAIENYENIYSLSIKKEINETFTIQKDFIEICFDGITISINNDLKNKLLTSISDYFDKYFDKTLIEMKKYAYKSNVYTNNDFIHSEGISLIKYMAMKKNCNFEDFDAAMSKLIPNKFIVY